MLNEDRLRDLDEEYETEDCSEKKLTSFENPYKNESFPRSKKFISLQMNDLYETHKKRLRDIKGEIGNLKQIKAQTKSKSLVSLQTKSEKMIISLAAAVVDATNEDALKAYSNQKRIAQLLKSVHGSVVQLENELSRWKEMGTEFEAARKHMGDVDNWMEKVENDIRTIMNDL
ncbi:hypothetical protein ACOME3_004068 [Neoechinorhynchus agilis]